MLNPAAQVTVSQVNQAPVVTDQRQQQVVLPQTSTATDITSADNTPVRDRQVEPMDCGTVTINDRVSPHNHQFIQHLQSHGDHIHQALSSAIATEPARRTAPMPGMAKLVSQVKAMVNNTILPEPSVTATEKVLYRQLLGELDKLAKNNYPWREAFTLAYKAAHFISFYHHKRIDTTGHRSRYKPDASLEKLQKLPWLDALQNPSHFESELDKVWHSSHLRFNNGIEVLYPLRQLKSFNFPCVDELDLAFFNRTLMLGIYPLGFFTNPSIRFDGADGLCADFFEHDILHSAYFSLPNPELFMPARVLMDRPEGGYQINCRLPSQSPVEETALGQVKIPREAIELLMFEIAHESNQSWLDSSTDFYPVMINNLFEQPRNPDSKLRQVYDNLEPGYTGVRKFQIQCAALLLQQLACNQFWHSKTAEQAETRLHQAMTDAVLLPPDMNLPGSLTEITRHGLIPNIKLTENQLQKHYKQLQDRMPAPEDIPLATFFAHPDWIRSRDFTVVRDCLAELNSNPAAKALIRSVSDLATLRQLLKNHRFCDYNKLRCFDQISFNQLVLDGLILSGFSFKNASINKCSLRYAELFRCDFSWASMRNVKMQNAEIFDTRFDYADLRDSNLFCLKVILVLRHNGSEKISTGRTSFSHARMNRCNLESISPGFCANTSTHLHYLEACKPTTCFDHACLDKARLSGKALLGKSISFSGASLKDIELGYIDEVLAHPLYYCIPKKDTSLSSLLNRAYLLQCLNNREDDMTARGILKKLSDKAMTAEQRDRYIMLCRHYKMHDKAIH